LINSFNYCNQQLEDLVDLQKLAIDEKNTEILEEKSSIFKRTRSQAKKMK